MKEFIIHDPVSQISAELGEELVIGRSSAAEQTTIFKSLGMAVEDVSAALLVYRNVQGKT